MSNQAGDQSRKDLDRQRAIAKREMLDKLARRGELETGGMGGDFGDALRRFRLQKGVPDASNFPRKDGGRTI